MTKKLTKIVNEEGLNEKHTIKLKSGAILESKDYDFSSEESKKRMEEVVKKQKAIRKSIIYTRADLDRVSYPHSNPIIIHLIKPNLNLFK